MDTRRSTTVVVVSALTAFLLSFLLDVTTDLPMLARWAVAVVGALGVGALLSRRGGAQGPRGQD